MDTYFGYVCSDLDLIITRLLVIHKCEIYSGLRKGGGDKKLWPRLDVNRQTGGRTGSDI